MRRNLREERENKKARETEAKRRENEKRKRREDVETGRETEDEVDGGYECRWCGENYRGDNAALRRDLHEEKCEARERGYV